MMRIDQKTMLFECMTDQEAAELAALASEIVMNGNSAYGHPMFEAWCIEFGLNGDHKLLTMLTAFPQRALLSVLRHTGFKVA